MKILLKKVLASPMNNARDPPSKNAPLENAQNALALKFFNYSGRKNRRVHPIIFFKDKNYKNVSRLLASYYACLIATYN